LILCPITPTILCPITHWFLWTILERFSVYYENLGGEGSCGGGVMGHIEIIHQISTKSREFSREFSEDLQSPLGQLIATRPPEV